MFYLNMVDLAHHSDTQGRAGISTMKAHSDPLKLNGGVSWCGPEAKFPFPFMRIDF